MISRMLLTGVGLGVVMTSPAKAAVVSVCADDDGEPAVAVASAAPAGCASAPADVTRDEVAWTGWLPRLPRADETVAAITSERGVRRLELRSATPAAGPTPALPIGVSLLPRLTPRPFGTEGRVEVEASGGRLRVRCGRGDKPAGVVLDPGTARLPRNAEFELNAHHRGHDSFRLSTVKAGADANGGAMLPGGDRRRTEIQLRPVDGAVQFVIECPAGGGDIELFDLMLGTARPAVAATRAAWAWKPELWRAAPAELISKAEARGIGRLYVALDIGPSGVRHAGALARFIGAAKARGIAVEAVEGDPRMVRPAGRTNALRRARAIARFQRDAAPDARFAGVQYDVEPYVLPEFGSDRAGVLTAWSTLIRDLSAAHGAGLDVVVPFWLVDLPDGAAALDGLGDRVRRVTVMAYRTDPALVGVIAEPTLAWGARRGVPVDVALEIGALDSEVEERFRAAPAGDLLLLPVGEGVAALRLKGSAAAGFRLASAGATPIPATRLSFLGDEARLEATVAALRAPLSAWTSFTGFAVHGLF